MDKQEEQIESKLIELEAEVKTEPTHNMTYRPPVSDFSSASEAAAISSELYLFAGLALVVAGFLLLFQHVRVGSGFFAMLGMGGGGFGLLMIPMLVGIGWIMYDSKSRIGWGIVAATCALILFAVLSSLIMTFPTLSLLGLIMMLLPFAVGGALLLKGLGGPVALKERLKKEGYIK